MEPFENMKTRTKIVLSLIGISAVLVPVALLMFVSQNTQTASQSNDAPRQIDKVDVGDQKNPEPSSSPLIKPTPSPLTASPSPVSGGNEESPVPR